MELRGLLNDRKKILPYTRRVGICESRTCSCRKAVECINKNLAFTKLADRAQVLSADAVQAVGMLERQGQAFDVIFMDPPYGKLLEKAVLERLAGSPLMDDDTMVIVESDLDTNFDYLDDLGLELYKTKKYKTNKHTFIYRRLEDE